MVDAVADIVEREFGVGPNQITRATGGLVHETYFVDVDKTAAVVQFANDNDVVDSLRRGMNCYRLFAGTPVPKVLSDGVSTYDGREYVIIERLSGESGVSSLSPERTKAAGRTLARIHATGPTFEASGRIHFQNGEATVDPPFRPNYRGWLVTALDDTLETLDVHGFETVDRIATLFHEHADAIPDAVEAILCHNDFSPSNVLYDGETVTGVLDFDRAYAGHDERDVVKAANAFLKHAEPDDWSVHETFYEGYQSVRALSATFERREPLYRVETLAGAVAGMLRLGEFSGAEATFYDERLAEAVERV